MKIPLLHRREAVQDELDGLKVPLLGDTKATGTQVGSHSGDDEPSNRQTPQHHEPPQQTHTPPTISALLTMSLPDAHIITAAVAAGSVAALAQALIPYYTGNIIDAAALESERAAFNRYTVGGSHSLVCTAQ